MERPDLKVIGKPIARFDALDKVTGTQKYLPDTEFQGCLYGKILRSPYPFAKIKSIDKSAAEALPGVRKVMTYEDTADYSFQDDKFFLAKDYVRFAGDEVAAVAADTELIATRALDLIKVEYEPLEGIYDPEEALKEGATLVHPEGTSNVAFEFPQGFGDVDKAFAECDYIMEHKYTTGMVAHCCMETCGVVAQWNNSRGSFALWGPFQAPHLMRQGMAGIFQVPPRKVTVNPTRIGGGFGQKSAIDVMVPLAVLLSKYCQDRPVRIINSREEELMASRGRYPFIINFKTGYNKDGRIVAQDTELIVDNGAYNSKAVSIAWFGGGMMDLLYKVENARFHCRGVYTNNQGGTAFRGFGNPQCNFAQETQMDRIAEHLGMDPIELRKKNPLLPGDSNPDGAFFATCAQKECYEAALTQGKWAQKRAASGRKGNKLVGTGFATFVHAASGGRYYGFDSQDTFLKVSEDGIVTLITDSCESGQGIHTVMLQIVMEELGLNADRVRIVDNCTDTMPYGLGCWGSRQSFVIGHSVKDAAQKVKKDLLVAAGRLLERDWNRLAIIDEKIYNDLGDKQYEDTGKTFDDIVSYCYNYLGEPVGAKGSFVDHEAHLSPGRREFWKDLVSFCTGCQIAQVEVDVTTGKIDITDIFCAQETGTTINPTTCEGQIEGALVQGIGMALTERVYREKGVQRTNGYVDYKVPNAIDMPQMELNLVEVADPHGPYGIKAAGESGLVPTVSAINNAIFDAVGVRFEKLPILPEDVLRALKEKGIK